MPEWAWVIVGVAGLLGVSSFFALAESALFSLGRWRLRRLVEQSPASGQRVEHLLSSPKDLLATLVLGNTAANAAAVAFVLWTLWNETWTVWVGLGVLGVLFALLVIGGEVVPKTLAVRSPERWSIRVARPMAWLVLILQPGHRIAQGCVKLVLRAVAARIPPPPPGLSDDEYEELTKMAWQSGTLGEAEKEMILNILQFDQRTAKDVMLPRSQMVCISDDLPVEEMLEAARRTQHQRLPVYDEDPDTIVGILNTRVLLLDPEVDLAEAIEFPSYVPESMNLLQLFKSLQRQQRGMAIVLDEYGGTVGLVTLEDILESMVGELRDEGEEEGFLMERLGAGRWRVNARLRLDDFRREVPTLQDVPEVETLGGLAVHLSERIPMVGESLVHQGLRLTVVAADERRVKELRVEIVGRKGGR
jgi:putative hemolysin